MYSNYLTVKCGEKQKVGSRYILPQNPYLLYYIEIVYFYCNKCIFFLF